MNVHHKLILKAKLKEGAIFLYTKANVWRSHVSDDSFVLASGDVVVYDGDTKEVNTQCRHLLNASFSHVKISHSLGLPQTSPSLWMPLCSRGSSSLSWRAKTGERLSVSYHQRPPSSLTQIISNQGQQRHACMCVCACVCVCVCVHASLCVCVYMYILHEFHYTRGGTRLP